MSWADHLSLATSPLALPVVVTASLCLSRLDIRGSCKALLFIVEQASVETQKELSQAFGKCSPQPCPCHVLTGCVVLGESLHLSGLSSSSIKEGDWFEKGSFSDVQLWLLCGEAPPHDPCFAPIKLCLVWAPSAHRFPDSSVLAGESSPQVGLAKEWILFAANLLKNHSLQRLQTLSLIAAVSSLLAVLKRPGPTTRLSLPRTGGWLPQLRLRSASRPSLLFLC